MNKKGKIALGVGVAIAGGLAAYFIVKRTAASSSVPTSSPPPTSSSVPPSSQTETYTVSLPVLVIQNTCNQTVTVNVSPEYPFGQPHLVTVSPNSWNFVLLGMPGKHLVSATIPGNLVIYENSVCVNPITVNFTLYGIPQGGNIYQIVAALALEKLGYPIPYSVQYPDLKINYVSGTPTVLTLSCPSGTVQVVNDTSDTVTLYFFDPPPCRNLDGSTTLAPGQTLSLQYVTQCPVNRNQVTYFDIIQIYTGNTFLGYLLITGPGVYKVSQAKTGPITF